MNPDHMGGTIEIEIDRAFPLTFGESDPKCGPMPAVLALLKALS